MTQPGPDGGPDLERRDPTGVRVDAALRAYLAAEPEKAPEHLLATTIERRRRLPQRSRRWPRWLPVTPRPIAAGVAAAAVVFAVVVGLPSDRGQVGTSPGTGEPESAGPLPSLRAIRVAATLPLDGPGLRIATDGTRGWVLRVGALVPFTASSVGAPIPVEVDDPREITARSGRPWATGGGGALITVDPATGQARRIAVGIDADEVAASDSAVWVTGMTGLRRLEIATGDVTSLPNPRVLVMAPADDLLWTIRDDRTIVAVDGVTGREVHVIPREARPGLPAAAIVVTTTTVWVIDPDDATRLLRMDRTSGQISGSVTLGFAADQLAVGSARLWAMSERANALATVDLGSLQVLDTQAIPPNASDLEVLSDRPVLLEVDRLLFVDSR